ncbi:chromate efflux transporter [Paraburkholderia bryophila]|uniref:Chromate transporter n=1 Tax=Paraburkholderia bryophila TaxID=420952 RepID=A0A7Y9WHT2_9BURK|nr:chromate efflux transporter [Paraburkholderia bryophila]NYH21059.1 chromate transporter [Paraburkholderia bryophila]
MASPSDAASRPRRVKDILDVFSIFLRLGLTSFGGPVAHLGYFRREFVERRRWLDDQSYSDLVALCQLLPGPASSQVGFSIGLMRAGGWGGLAAWCGFTLPSALLLIAFASLAPHAQSPVGQGLIHGLKLVAVAVVAQAVWDMGRRLCPDRPRSAIAVLAMAVLAIHPTVYSQLLVIALGALLGAVFCRTQIARNDSVLNPEVGRLPAPRVRGLLALATFCILLFGLPAMLTLHDMPGVRLFDAFYRSGALVFGGGHVVLPLLQQRVVATGWISPSDFLAGYGASQAVPGPLFSFAAFLGWTISAPTHRWAGAALATVAIFLPGLLLVIAALPYYRRLRTHPTTAAMLNGVNAAIVGLLATALYSPVWISSVLSELDFAIAALCFLLLTRWKMPPFAVVLICALAGVVEFSVR